MLWVCASGARCERGGFSVPVDDVNKREVQNVKTPAGLLS